VLSWNDKLLCVELLCAAFANKTIKSEARFPENEDMPTDFVSRIIAANVVVSDVGDVMIQAVNLLLARRAAALTGSSEMGTHHTCSATYDIFMYRRQ